MLNASWLKGIQYLSREVELQKLLQTLISLIHRHYVWEKYLVVITPLGNHYSQLDDRRLGAIYLATADAANLSSQLYVENVELAEYQAQIPQTLITHLKSLGKPIFGEQRTIIAALNHD